MKKCLIPSITLLLTMAAACTQSSSDHSDTSIIGGRLADYHPFMVMLSDEAEDSTNYCGGSWVAEGVILTAAHCVEDMEKRAKVTVSVMKEGQANEVNSVKVRAVVVHPDYNPSLHQAMYNDIALLFVEPLNHGALSQPVAPIALNSTHSLPEDLGKVTAIGWGNESSYGFMFSGDLRQVEVPVIGTEACKAAGSSYDRVWEHEICAGDMEAGGIDACQGDSGGPLIAMKDGRPVLVGIVSWGINCANKGKPGVYTRVSSFTGWIYEQIGRYNTAAPETASDIKAAVAQHCYTGFGGKTNPYPDSPTVFEVKTKYLQNSEFTRHTNVPQIASPKSTCSFNRSGLGNVRVDIEEIDNEAKMHVVLENGATWIADLDEKRSLLAICSAAKNFILELEESYSWLNFDSAWYRTIVDVESPDFTGFETQECRVNGTSVLFGQKKGDDDTFTYMATLESSEIGRAAKTYLLSKSGGSSAKRLAVTANFNGSKTEADFEVKNETGEDVHTWELVCPFSLTLTDTYGAIYQTAERNEKFKVSFLHPSTVHGIIKNNSAIRFKATFKEDFELAEFADCTINGTSFTQSVIGLPAPAVDDQQNGDISEH